MRKCGGEPMSCGYSPTPPAACAWSAHSPSKPTKTGSKPTATSIWTNCAGRRKPNYAKPHDQHHDRQFAELDAHNLGESRPGTCGMPYSRYFEVEIRNPLTDFPVATGKVGRSDERLVGKGCVGTGRSRGG